MTDTKEFSGVAVEIMSDRSGHSVVVIGTGHTVKKIIIKCHHSNGYYGTSASNWNAVINGILHHYSHKQTHIHKEAKAHIDRDTHILRFRIS